MGFKEVKDKLRELLKSAFDGITVGETDSSVTIIDKYYPDAFSKLMGTNITPAIIIRDNGTFSTESSANDVYDETREIRFYVYVNNNIDNVEDISQEIEDIIVKTFLPNTYIGVNQAYIMYQGTTKGDKQIGNADYFNEGYYDDLAIMYLSFNVFFRRCSLS